MRKNILLLLAVLLAGAFFELSPTRPGAAAGPDGPCASLTSVSGPIRYSGVNSADFKLYGPDEARRLKIMDQDRIITGDETTAELLIANAARVDIREKSQVQVGFYNLRIKTGDIWINYKPVRDGDKMTFRVFTPTGTIGIKGTRFEVLVAGENGPTTVRVAEGVVEYEAAGGTGSVMISSGEELSAGADGELGVPSKFGAGEELTRKTAGEDNPAGAQPQGGGPAMNNQKKFNMFDDMSGYSIEILKK